MNKLHNQQIHPNELEFLIMVDKQFIQNQHQLQLKKKIKARLMTGVKVKN
jgi:hypothetical protein